MGIAERLKNRSASQGECLIWLGYKDKGGYGMIWSNNTMRLTHRVAWEIENGSIPANIDVLHRCDHPSCIAPNHLFLGTNQDNMDDMKRKGRSPQMRGERNGRSLLTDEAVRTIRVLRKRRIKLRMLAERFGVSLQTIHDIAERKRWKHVS